MAWRALACATALALPAAGGKTVPLATFDGAEKTTWPWQPVNDPVMGGTSNSTFHVDTSRKVGVWDGEVRVVPFLHDPGFCNLQAPGLYKKADFPDVSGTAGITVVARETNQSGRTHFNAMLTTSGARHLFQQGVYTANYTLTGSMEAHFVPWEAFVCTWRGQPVTWCPDIKTQLSKIQDIGVGTAFPGRAARFTVELQSISATTPSGAVTAPGPEPIDLATFDGAASHAWHSENDPVMGGRSESKFEVQGNVGDYSGVCRIVPSLKAPGFTIALTEAPLTAHFPDVSSVDGIILGLRNLEANITKFKFAFCDSRYKPLRCQFQSFKADFEIAPSDHFSEVFLPWSAFSDKWSASTGKHTAEEPPTAESLRSITQLQVWTEGLAGKFHLQLKYVRAGKAPPRLMGDEGDVKDMKAALAEKGYDLVETQEGSDSDSDGGGIPGRIQSLEPGLAREKGNKAFQDGKYDKAIRCWQGGLKAILSSLCAGPQAMSDNNLSELDLTLNLNIAMAHMKKGDFDAADRAVDKALARREALPPHLITKALYRKASAQKSMHRLEESLATLKDLLEVEETHAAARQMLNEVDRELARQIRDQKKNMRKLFSKLGDEDRELQGKRRVEQAEARRRSGVRWAADDVDQEAFDSGQAPAADGKDWGLSMSRSVLWSIEQFAVQGNHFLVPESGHLCIWFLGASSTCELRWLQGKTLMSRLPGIKSLELVLIGFLGELDPENKRVPDPKADGVPEGAVSSKLDGGRSISLRCIKGTLQEALQKELAAPPASDLGEASEATGATGAGESEAAPTPEEPLQPQVPPSVCFLAHPQLHRYFSDFHPAVSWLIDQSVPTVVIGASDPDPSWNQDEVLLKALGANITVGKRLSPYPMSLPDNPAVRKCNHMIGFLGGKALERDRLTKAKLELLAQDYSVR